MANGGRGDRKTRAMLTVQVACGSRCRPSGAWVQPRSRCGRLLHTVR